MDEKAYGAENLLIYRRRIEHERLNKVSRITLRQPMPNPIYTFT